MLSSCRTVWLAVAIAVSLLSVVPAHAQDDVIPGESFHWQAQLRAVYLNPSNQHLPLDFNLSGAVVGELAGEWLFMPHWSTEIAAAMPATLDVQGGPGAIRLTTQTWTAKYYFPATSGLTPYVGTGIYHASAARDNTMANVGVGNPGVGWVLQAGCTYGVTTNVLVSADVRYLDHLEPTLIVDNAPSGHIGINPLLFSLGVGVRF
jgi:outer membrane protein W